MSMSERELEEIENSAHGYMQGVERYGYDRAYGREADIEDMAEEMLNLLSEVRRSHAEAAEAKLLREREQTLRAYLARRLGTSEASRDRDDFKRGYAQALEYAISLVDVPPTNRAALSPANAQARLETRSEEEG